MTRLNWDTESDWQGAQDSEDIAIDGGSIGLASAIPDSAIHRWQFGEGSGSTAADSIGSEDGTINGATWVSDTWQDGNALDFDGTDDDVTVAYNTDFDMQTFSIAATVELDTLTSNQYRIVDFFSGGSYGYQFNSQDGAGNNAMEFILHDGSTAVSTIANTSLSTGTKYRCLVAVNSGSVTFYLNATEDGTASLSSFATVDSNLDWVIGRNQQGGLETDGRIDDVIFYGSELTSSEAQDDYDAQPWT